MKDRTSYKHLTQEIDTESSPGRILGTILGTIAVTLILNALALRYIDQYPFNRGYWLVKEKWNILSSLQAPVDALILGDSSANQGIVPEQFTKETSFSSLNLATIGNMTMANDVYMLQDYISRFGAPKEVVIVHVYDMWERNLAHTLLAKTSIPWYALDSLTPSPNLSSREKVEFFLTQYVPIYAENKTLATVIMNKVFGPEKLFQKRMHIETTGFMPVQKANPDRVRNDMKKHLRWLENRSFKLSDINQKAMQELIRLADTHSMHVYIANSPLYEGMFDEEPFRRYYKAMQNSLRDLSNQSDFVHFLDMTVVFPADEMQNLDHLTQQSAVRYTQMLVEAISNSKKR